VEARSLGAVEGALANKVRALLPRVHAMRNFLRHIRQIAIYQ
jgi:hypothetical protein